MKKDRDVEIGVMANAIGYVMYGGDPEPYNEFSEINVITLTAEQAKLCAIAAERSLAHLEAFRGGEGRSSIRFRIKFAWAPKGNVCIRGHSFNTRIPWISELWWLKHDKCWDR